MHFPADRFCNPTFFAWCNGCPDVENGICQRTGKRRQEITEEEYAPCAELYARMPEPL